MNGNIRHVVFKRWGDTHVVYYTAGVIQYARSEDDYLQFFV